MRNLFLLLLGIGFVSGNLIKVSLPFFTTPIPIFDLIILSIVSLTIISQPRKFFIYLRHLPVLKPALLFSFISLISLLLGTQHFGFSAGLVGAAYWIRWQLYSLALPAAFSLLFPSRIDEVFSYLGLLLLSVSLLQYFIFPDIRPLQVYAWDPHYYRVVGSLLDPGFTGLLLLLALIQFSRFPSFFWGLTYFALAFTYSRSSLLAFLSAAAFVSFRQRLVKLFLSALLLVLLTLLFLPRSPDGEGVKLERTSSIVARLTNWKNSLTIFSSRPVLGVGFNLYRYAQNEFGYLGQSDWQTTHAGAGADSSLLFTAATTGIIGLLAYLLYLRRLFLSFDIFGQVSFVALLVHSLFLNSLYYPFVLCWLALLLVSKHPSTSDT